MVDPPASERHKGKTKFIGSVDASNIVFRISPLVETIETIEYGLL